MIRAIIETIRWSKRVGKLRDSVLKEIEAEGGQVHGVGPIGLILRSPFPAVGYQPVYLQVKCTYDADSGVWFVRGSSDGSVQWVWKSDARKATPPVKRRYPVAVKNNVLALPSWAAYVLYAVFVAAAVGGPFLYLALT